MRIYYLAGITAAGKTTLARQLADHLGIGVTGVDTVYSIIARRLRYTKQEELVLPEFWERFEKFGALKSDAYVEWFADKKGKDMVIEGFPLMFEQDRQLMQKALGEHEVTYFYYKPSVATWLERAYKKYGKPHSEKDWEKMNAYFEPPKEYYEIKDENLLFVHHEPYQRSGLTDKKWKILTVNPKGKTVFDLGCNSGWIGKYCLERGAKDVLGVDYNWRYLDEARGRGLRTKLMRLEDISRLNETADITFCLATMHYILDKEKFIREVSEKTKELFVLEIPILWEDGLKLGKKNHYFIPTKDLILEWLNKYFSKVEVVGETPAPDDSRRLAFKAWK
jgi:SAM-dependent methyltransferase